MNERAGKLSVNTPFFHCANCMADVKDKGCDEVVIMFSDKVNDQLPFTYDFVDEWMLSWR